MKKFRLVLDLHGQALAGDRRRPSQVIADLGIKYEDARGESFAGCFIFSGCTQIPEILPHWLTAREEG